MCTGDDSGACGWFRLGVGFEVEHSKRFDTKHESICYLTHQIDDTHLISTGFDYKVCLWDIKKPKKSHSVSLHTVLVNELGA